MVQLTSLIWVLLVLVATAGVYSLSEWLAGKRCAGPRHCGIRLFKRVESLRITDSTIRELRQFLYEGTLEAFGLEILEYSEKEYTISVPLVSPKARDSRLSQVIVTGRLLLDRSQGVVELKAGIAPGWSAVLIVWPVTLAALAVAHGKPGSAVVFLFLVYTSAWAAYNFVAKVRLQDFWFLLTTRLAMGHK